MFLLEELLLLNEVSQMSVPGLSLLFLLAHLHQQAELVLSRQARQRVLSLELGRISILLVTIDA